MAKSDAKGPHPMEVYETLLGLSRSMLLAARNAQWDQLLTLEQDCRVLVDKLLLNNEAEALSPSNRKRRNQIIRHVLADDAEIRDLTDPAMARGNRFLSSHYLERKLLGRGEPN